MQQPRLFTLFPYTTLFRSLLRKKGADIGAKRAGNETKHGLIHTYIHPGSTLGVIVEISCETDFAARTETIDRSTRLNSSHANISYAVFCLKKKKLIT